MYSKMWRKVIAISLAVTMALGLAACSKTKTDSSTETAADPTAAVTEAAADVTIDPLEPYNQPITIKVGYILNSDLTYYGGEDAYNNSWIQAYKDYLNIDVEVMWVVDQSQAKAKLNAAIASGDYPDIIVSDASDYVNYANSGVIADVTDLYDNYLTDDAKAALSVDGGYAVDAARIGGKLYGIPTISTSTDSMECLYVRQDWLDNLGLSAPTTVDELEKVAEAFTTQDPDGNGKDDTYGLSLDGVDLYNWWGGAEAFFESYGAYPLTSGSATNFSLVKDASGKLVWGGENENMKTALTALNNYYNNGWIAQDFGTNDYTKAMSEITTGKAGMFFAPMFGVMSIATDLCANIPDAKFTAVPLPGTTEGQYGKSFYVSSFSGCTSVSTKCEHPEALFKMYNLGLSLVAYQKDPLVFAKYNGDSTNYTGWKLAVVNPLLPFKNYDNYKAVSAAVAARDDSTLNVEQKGYYDASIYYLDNKLTADNIDIYAADYGQYAVFADPNGGYAAIAKAYESGAYQEAGYGAAATETMAACSSTLTDNIKTGIIKIVYGEESADYWDTVVKNWHSLGGDDVLTEANEWLTSK